MSHADPAVLALEGGVTKVRRGARLAGVVRARPEHVVGATLSVEWYTEGKGNRDSDALPTLDLETLPARPQPDGSLEIPFSVPLPLWPVTYLGEIIKIHWRVAVRLPAMAWQERDHELEFEVLP